ncbi:MAG TPA: RNA 2',3'-cyclic phosphodiesterase [Leptospiraceae bacterium]|nr:RNA 2',3'-cyclic phosphodiesterase [Spirochaetaceae bacterium]HBS06921.1 RNA 2',3'-cyclic phosphodiesterase [Leptospiraceae bacterium]|tara:strand:+ start:171645 stop:172193 length:549 start_codon:yes stop_codon:yes gene_type:complete
MSEQRIFIALTLPEQIIQDLTDLQSGLPDIRWNPPEQMHVTLKFLGNVEESLVESLCSELESLELEAPEVRVSGVGQFAQRKAPPVLWAGLTPEEPLIEMHRAIEAMTGRLGFAREKRPFRPHVTLGRLKRSNPRRLHEYLELHHTFGSAPFQCTEVILFSSKLTSDGAIHEPLMITPLAAA